MPARPRARQQGWAVQNFYWNLPLSIILSPAQNLNR